MLAQHLNDAATVSSGELIPLKIPASMGKGAFQLVALQFIRRENAHRVRILHQYLVQQSRHNSHCTMRGALLLGEFPPIRHLGCNIGIECLWPLTQLFFISWNYRLDFGDDIPRFRK